MTAFAARTARVQRDTRETQIAVAINLDGGGTCEVSTGIGFFDHMLDQIARHGLIDLNIQAQGDLHIDGHHTVEDVGITLGQALAQALGDKRGIRRYGHAYVPLDEALSRVVIDCSGSGMGMPANPQQATANKITPVMITGMFLFFPLPAGVLLYMVIANVFQAVQTFLLTREALPDNLQSILDQQLASEAKTVTATVTGSSRMPFEPKGKK